MVYGKIRHIFLNIEIIIETLKMYDTLFIKLFMNSNHLLTFKSCCQNEENYEINSYYKIYQTQFCSHITK